MSKFTLEVELENDKYSNYCDQLNFYTDYCAALKQTIEGGTALERPSNCPLKPVEDKKCGSCAWYTDKKMNTLSSLMFCDNLMKYLTPSWYCADWEKK